MLHTYKINGTDEHILPFLNDKKLDNFIIGNNTENIENLHIFKHLETTFTSLKAKVDENDKMVDGSSFQIKLKHLNCKIYEVDETHTLVK